MTFGNPFTVASGLFSVLALLGLWQERIPVRDLRYSVASLDELLDPVRGSSAPHPFYVAARGQARRPDYLPAKHPDTPLKFT
jgi:hypothetical protein